MIDLPAALLSITDAIEIADIEIGRLERRIDAALQRRHRLMNEQVILLTALDDSLATVEPMLPHGVGQVRAPATTRCHGRE